MVIDKINNTTFQIRVSSRIYNIETLHKCFYWYSDKFSIDIASDNELAVITLSNFPEELEFDDILSTIKKDLIDFKTRDIVARETLNIRTLLIAKAFANNDEFDEEPFGDINDPVGFDAKEF